MKPVLMSRGRIARLAFFIAMTVIALLLAACSKSGSAATQYHCPMHPTYVSDKPGDCPICGMRLVPIEPGKAKPEFKGAPAAPLGAGVAGMAPIDVRAEGLRLAGVRTAVAENGRIDRTIRAVGVVRPEETRIRHVHTKTSGYIEKLFIDFTGQPVQKGRPILSMYSPELLASQQEYTRAREAAANLEKVNDPTARQAADQMLSGARRRLELFDVPASSIAELDRSGSARRTVTLLAPVSGIVTSKGVFEGMQVEPGTELFTVSDLSSVWIEADVYENEASVVKVGQEARLTLAYQPGTEMKGKVKYIYPYLNPATRTLKVRFDFPNPDLALKLDMYVTVELPVQSEEGVIVPDSAIMDTGVRQIAFVNPTEGRFEPRLVKVGIRADGRAQILTGVAAGERVAIKANFLLDSESRLRAAISGVATAAPAASGAAP
jgi:membrane fusion protein, copper/silver efflux system